MKSSSNPQANSKVLLLGATLDSDNRGIGALAMGAISIVNHCYRDCTIQLVDYGHKATVKTVETHGREILVPLINLRFSKKFWLPNNIAWLMLLAVLTRVGGPTLRRQIIASNPWLTAINEAKVAVAVSGGDSFSDIYGLGRFLYMALPQMLMILLRIPLILLPQTIGPLKSPFAKFIAKYIVRHARACYTRDLHGIEATLDTLNLYGSRANVKFAHDMGFLLEPRKPKISSVELFKSDRPLIGLNVSGLLAIGGYSGSNMFSLKCDYLQLVEDTIKLFVETRKANVLLIPHVFGQEAESDLHAVRLVYERLKDRYPEHLNCITETLDQHEVKYVIGQCDVFIGARMHACIAALSQGVPAVGIAYSQKFAGVVASIGVGDLVADPRSMSIEKILRIVDTVFTKRSDIKQNLSRTMPKVKNNLINLLATVG